MSYFNEAVNAIEEFSKRFRKNPWNYLYEADVQFELMQCLKEKITGLDLTYDSHKISAVKSEYPGMMELDVGNRFDLVVIDTEKNDAHICNRPVSIAIELKLNIDEKNIGDYICNKYKCTVEKDIDKLSDGFKRSAITTAGFAILCVKPYATKKDGLRTDVLCNDAIKILEDPNGFNLTPIIGFTELENQPISSEPLGTYAVIVDGNRDGKNHYFKLTKFSA